MKRVALALALLLTVLIVCASTGSEQQNKGVVLFRLGRVDSNIVNDRSAKVRIAFPDYFATPIAIYKDQAFVAPAGTGSCMKDAAWRAFEVDFVQGPAFTYFAGELRGPLELSAQGGERKLVQISGWQKISPPSNMKQALASNSTNLGRTKVTRRAAKDEEKTEFVHVAQNILAKDLKVPATELSDLETGDVLSTELGDGKSALIGTVLTRGTAVHSLFLVIEQRETSWVPVLADHQLSDPKKGPSMAMRLVDQLDVDGDGVDEIFAENTRMLGFRIYGFRGGRWKVLYEDRRDGAGCITQIR